MTTINVSETAKLKWSGDSWQPITFVPGGKLVFSPAHKKEVVTEDKWVVHHKYFSELKYAIKYLAREHCLSKQEYSSLSEYLAEYNTTMEQMLVAAKAG